MIKKILIVDDDNFKSSNIIQLINKLDRNIDIHSERSLNSGLRKIHYDQFDMILLDMSMPIFDKLESSNFDSFGGISFLKEMRRKENSTPTIIITQYEIFGEGHTQKNINEIDQLCKTEFKNYKGIIVYSSTNNTWKEKVAKIIGGQTYG